MAALLIASLLMITGLATVFGPTKGFSDEISHSFLTWASFPNLPGNVTTGWMISDLDAALKIVGGYFILVAVGLFIKKEGEEEGKISPMVDKPVKALQLVYNLFQCVLCIYMIWRTVDEYITHHYVPICNKFNATETGMAKALYLFYLSKILDFCDTLFIVLRQKWKQMSFLHIYHHTSIFLVYWMNLRAGYDGDVYLTIVLNAFVHLMMYSYYFLSTLGYNAWWKNYITLLQMAQFIVMNVQAIYMIYFKCPYPQNITWFYLIYIISLFVLFQNFYQRTYTKKAPSSINKKKI